METLIETFLMEEKKKSYVKLKDIFIFNCIKNHFSFRLDFKSVYFYV